MKSFYFEDKKKKKINGEESERNLKSQLFVKRNTRNLSNGHDNVKHHAMLQANQAHLKNSHLINGRQHSKSQQLVNSLNSFFATDGKSSLEQRKSQLEKLSLQYVLSKGKIFQNLFFMSFF